MIDWKNTFDIVFVAASLALMAFLFASVIAVVAKGKRKRNAFDIILRIVASLVLIASTALLLCVIMTMLSGGFCIAVDAVAGKALLFIGDGKGIELPMPRLFVILSTSFGAIIAFGLFILSLIALIADCRLANLKDKDGKAKKTKQKKSNAKKTPEQIKREAELAKIKRLADVAVKKTSTAADRASEETTIEAETEQSEAQSDWRVSDSSQNKSEFVGLSDERADDGFDTFDDVEETQVVSSVTETEEYSEQTESYTQTESADVEADETENYEQTDESAFTQEAESVETQTDSDGEAEYYEETEETEYSESSEERETRTEETEYAGSAQDGEAQERRDESFGGYGDDSEYSVGEREEFEDYLDGNVEPDRDIYIPKVRTIVKPNESASARPQKQAAKKPAQKPTGKPAANKASGKAANKKSTDGKGAKTGADNKRLPVNRRYVIIDRHSAVNMFGKYLKERDGDGKNKLESSINTIIIK